MVKYDNDLQYYFCNRNNIKTPGIKSLRGNLCEFVKLQFNSR